MNARLIFLLALCLSLASAGASEEPGSVEKKPGLGSKLMMPWKFFQHSGPRPNEAAAKWKQLAMTVRLEPQPLSLSETRQLKVTLQLVNKGGKLVQLDFPTTQRIEVLVRNGAGKMIEQWSEDQSFAQELTLVAINPGERLEYSVTVSTRDLAAGQTYFVDAFFPNYEQLKATKSFMPEK